MCGKVQGLVEDVRTYLLNTSSTSEFRMRMVQLFLSCGHRSWLLGQRQFEHRHLFREKEFFACRLLGSVVGEHCHQSLL